MAKAGAGTRSGKSVPGAWPRRRLAVVTAIATIGALALAACGTERRTSGARSPEATTSPSATSPPSGKGSGIPKSVQMSKPGPLKGSATSPDILVFASNKLPDDVVKKARAIDGVTEAEQFSMGQFYSEDTAVTYAAVSPATFRRFTPAQTAAYTTAWDRVAGGEMAMGATLAKKLEGKDGYVRLGNASSSPRLHIGAYADLTPVMAARPFVDAVVNEKWARRLDGMVRGNALVLSTGSRAPEKISVQVRKLAGNKASVSILSHTYDLKALQTALVTGTPISRAIGHYTYTANGNGTVNPDPAWVKTFIRSAQVPLLGNVTCNKVMLPALRAALTDVVQAGLSAKVYRYDGCFVPRFINRNPADGLSNHSFGTAIDINAAENYRGIRGQMDIRVVQIFEKYGFSWGGRWNYTDPMHFELNQVVQIGG